MPSFATHEELIAYRDRVWEEHTFRCGGFRFLWVTGQSWINGMECERLTENESDVLHTLIKAYPLALDGPAVLRNLTVDSFTRQSDMKVWVFRIRRKLRPEIILTTPRGYAFNAEAAF